MACKYQSECKFHRSDNLPESIISDEYRNNICNYPSAEEYQRGINSLDNLNVCSRIISCLNQPTIDHSDRYLQQGFRSVSALTL